MNLHRLGKISTILRRIAYWDREFPSRSTLHVFDNKENDILRAKRDCSEYKR
jgi:hypothetical protein